MSRSPRRPEVEEVVAAYRDDLQAAGMFAGHPVTSPARSFLTRVGVDGWGKLTLAEQCAMPPKYRQVAGWLMVTGRLRPAPDYLVAGRPYLGEIAARHHRAFHERFRATSAGLGFAPRVARLQWSAVTKVAVLAGVAPDQLAGQVVDDGQAAGPPRLAGAAPSAPARRT